MHGLVGQAMQALGLLLPFTFRGRLPSVCYSPLPVVQPIQKMRLTIITWLPEVVATLRASPWDTFWRL